MVTLVTSNGEEHGIINKLSNSVKDTGGKHYEPAFREQIKKDKERDNKLIKCRYINHKKGYMGRLNTQYMKYAGDPILIINLIPGYVYELPKGFIDQVNSIKPIKRSDMIGTVDKSGNIQHINQDESPTRKDSLGEQEHELIPLTFD